MDWDAVSDDVSAILGEGEERQESRHLSVAQRKERERQAARVRIVADAPQWLKDEVARIASLEQASVSSVVARLLAEGVRAYRGAEVLLDKAPCDSPRFEFLVEVYEGDAGL